MDDRDRDIIPKIIMVATLLLVMYHLVFLEGSIALIVIGFAILLFNRTYFYSLTVSLLSLKPESIKDR